MKSQEWQAVTDCVDELVDAILERYVIRARANVVRALEARLFVEIARAAKAADEEVAAPALELPFVPWPEFEE